jgi:hypothetical protein
LRPQAQEPEGIRQRSIANPSQQTQAITTSSSTNRYNNNTGTKSINSTTQDAPSRESQIATHDTERESLQRSLLDLAVQLKQSARGFNASMEAEKGILDAAASGLDKTMGGMEGAGGKMKQLSRETEGAGWFRRMRLYAEVAGLWVLVVLLVFVFPKLRF